jgi:ribosomal protein L35
MSKKAKTSKTISKRIVKVSSKQGKIYVRAMTSQHLASNKSKRSRKRSGNKVALSAADSHRLRKAL